MRSVSLEDGRIASLEAIHPLTGEKLGRPRDNPRKCRLGGFGVGRLEDFLVYPATHFVSTRPEIENALKTIADELRERLAELKDKGKLLEAQRLEQRTRYDMEMLKELGFCNGVENYSRHLTGRPPGARPYCLLDFLPEDALLVIDESHVSVPQVRGMYEGDRSRKQTLVDFGFRLPSALDNRPLRFPEFEAVARQRIHVSATPGPYELKAAGGIFVEQVIRPTGLVDPPVEVHPTEGQIPHLIGLVTERARRKERSLVLTLTKRTSEDLCEYLAGKGLRVRYLRSDIDALTRIEILQELRQGQFDVLVGINLLREGLARVCGAIWRLITGVLRGGPRSSDRGRAPATRRCALRGKSPAMRRASEWISAAATARIRSPPRQCSRPSPSWTSSSRAPSARASSSCARPRRPGP